MKKKTLFKGACAIAAGFMRTKTYRVVIDMAKNPEDIAKAVAKISITYAKAIKKETEKKDDNSE